MTATTTVLPKPAKAPEPTERGVAVALRERPEVAPRPEDPRGATGDVLLPQWVAQAGLRAFRPFIAERRPNGWCFSPAAARGSRRSSSRAPQARACSERTGAPTAGASSGDAARCMRSISGCTTRHSRSSCRPRSTCSRSAPTSRSNGGCGRHPGGQGPRLGRPEALRPALISLLAHDTRIFRVDQVFEADRAVAAALHGHDIGKDYGLETTLRVQLSADPGAAAHAAARRALQQKVRSRNCSSTTAGCKKPTRRSSSGPGSGSTGRSSRPVTSSSSPCSWRATQRRSRPSSRWS